MNTATVLCTYNRPEHTAQVVDALRWHQVENLYVFCDSGKDEHAAEQVRRVHSVVATIDWGLPVVELNKDANRGLAASIVHAVDTALKSHDSVIVLEDDTVPAAYFFDYMHECLNRYYKRTDIMGMSGYTIPIPKVLRDAHPWDVYFHPRIGSWGWATWRRAWALYERDVSAAYYRALEAGIDLNQGGCDVPHMIQQRMQGKLDAWTGGWLLATYLQRAYYVYPMVSHIQNIGMDGTGVHCSTTERFKTLQETVEPTRYPDSVILNDAIRMYFRTFYK